MSNENSNAVSPTTNSGGGGNSGDAEQQQKDMPPMVRASLTLGLQVGGFFSWAIRGSPGFQGSLMYKGKAYCFAAGWRDNTRGNDADDKGNYLRLRDPMSYHQLTIPITGHLVWLLHKANKFDAEAPLTQYIPQLPPQFERLNALDILSFQAGLNDDDVLRPLGIAAPMMLYPNVGPRTYATMWTPLRKMFGGVENDAAATTTAAAGCRGKLIDFFSGDKIGRAIRIGPRRPFASARCPSHFAFAILAAAIDRALKKPFEDVMFEHVLDPLQALSAAYGVPQVIRQSNLFFQPKGIANGHYSMKQSVALGSIENAAPPIFNSSLNLYALAEDYSKLLIEALVSVQKSLEVFPGPSTNLPFHQLGVRFDPVKQTYRLLAPMDGKMMTPFCGSFFYDIAKDCGAFSVGNCGSFRARVASNAMTIVIPKHFIRSVLNLGIDPLDDESSKEATTKVQRQVDKSIWSRVFKRDSHMRL